MTSPRIWAPEPSLQSTTIEGQDGGTYAPSEPSLSMTGDEFAQLLAPRLQAVVPRGFHVRANGSMLWFTAEPGIGYFGGSAGSHAVEHFFSRWGPAPLADRAALAGEMALDELQDYVDEESTELWPGKTPSGPARAHAEVCDGKLRMWFGDEGAEVLMLEPIELHKTGPATGRD